MIWDELTSPQLDNLDRDIPVFLPISATEQHGAHLPLATDRMIGWHFLKELDALISDRILILPPVAVGCSEHHMDFAGTLTVSHDSMHAYVEEIVEAVSTHGFRNVVIFNSHGGNSALSQVLVESLGPRFSGNLVAATWWRLAVTSLLAESQTGPGGVGHAGEFETSLMLLIAPNLVSMDQVKPKANRKTFPWAEGDLLRGAHASYFRSMQEMTPTGVFGDPAKSSAAQGQRITEIVIERLRHLVDDLYTNRSYDLAN